MPLHIVYLKNGTVRQNIMLLCGRVEHERVVVCLVGQCGVCGRVVDLRRLGKRELAYELAHWSRIDSIEEYLQRFGDEAAYELEEHDTPEDEHCEGSLGVPERFIKSFYTDPERLVE